VNHGMGPISMSELGDAAHRGGADGAAAAAVFRWLRQRSGESRGHEVRGAKGGARWVLAREDERGKEKGAAVSGGAF
jgi:hypothetical protein